jgi:hypothetical protein
MSSVASPDENRECVEEANFVAHNRRRLWPETNPWIPLFREDFAVKKKAIV